jgi:Flp pilus assembly protein CpaB
MARGSSAEAVRPAPSGSNGHRPGATAGGLEIAGRTKRRPTLALAGVGLVALAMLVGAWVFAAQSSTVQVLVAAGDLDAGQVLGAGDVRVVELSRTGGLRAVQPAQQDLLVGRAARGPIPAGTVLNAGLFAEPGQVVPAGQIVVGVALEPGGSPSSRLAAGDRVEVLAVARTTGAGTGEAPPASVVATGSVWSVEPIGTGASASGKTWVSLLVPQSTHAAVAQAAAEGRLRVGLLGAGS